jgi:hypothetical protein
VNMMVEKKEEERGIEKSGGSKRMLRFWPIRDKTKGDVSETGWECRVSKPERPVNDLHNLDKREK